MSLKGMSSRINQGNTILFYFFFRRDTSSQCPDFDQVLNFSINYLKLPTSRFYLMLLWKSSLI